MANSFGKVSLLKIRRTLEKSGLSRSAQVEIMSKLDRQASGNGSIRISRISKRKIEDALSRDGKCGLFVSGRGKVYVVKGSKVEFRQFNFQNKGILEKALLRRNENSTAHVAA